MMFLSSGPYVGNGCVRKRKRNLKKKKRRVHGFKKRQFDFLTPVFTRSLDNRICRLTYSRTLIRDYRGPSIHHRRALCSLLRQQHHNVVRRRCYCVTSLCYATFCVMRVFNARVQYAIFDDESSSKGCARQRDA